MAWYCQTKSKYCSRMGSTISSSFHYHITICIMLSWASLCTVCVLVITFFILLLMLLLAPYFKIIATNTEMLMSIAFPFEPRVWSFWIKILYISNCPPSRMFLLLPLRLDYWIEPVATGLQISVLIGDILQGGYRLCKWLCLQCLVPWINHFPLYVSPLFGYLVPKKSCCVSFT